MKLAQALTAPAADIPRIVAQIEQYPALTKRTADFWEDLEMAERKVADPSFHMTADLKAKARALD